MKKRTRNILIGLGIIFCLFFGIGGHFISKHHHEKVRSSPKMYCYQTYWGPPNPVLIIQNMKYRDNYISYYKTISSGSNISIPFPLKGLPQYEPVYVLGYTEDSLLADVVSYYDRGVYGGGSYTRGWVYAKTLHKNPPPKRKK